jgi:hypothetical protein
MTEKSEKIEPVCLNDLLSHQMDSSIITTIVGVLLVFLLPTSDEAIYVAASMVAIRWAAYRDFRRKLKRMA